MAKTFDHVSAGHHQVMRPKGEFILYGWNPEPVRVWTGEEESHEEEGTAEIVWWPKTKSLAIQPHPEWEPMRYKDGVIGTPFIQWLNGLVEELDIDYKF